MIDEVADEASVLDQLAFRTDRVLWKVEERVKQKYSTVGTWLTTLPWTELDPVESVHADLAVREGEATKERPLRYEDLLVSSRRVLLHGDAGCGKTTLLARLAQDWATENSEPLARFRILTLFRLTDLAQDSSLEESLTEFFRKYAGDEEEGFELREAIERASPDLLLLLDSFDEVTERVQLSVATFLNESALFGAATVLLASRSETSGCQFDRRVRVCPLSTASRDKMADMSLPGDRPELMRCFEDLMDLPFLSHMTPLLVCAVCYVLQYSDEYIFRSKSSLVLAVVRTSIKRSLDKLSLTMTDGELDKFVSTLEEFFYRKVRDCAYVFDDSEINSCFRDWHYVVKNMEILQPKGQNEFVAVHKVFMDNLAVSYLRRTFRHVPDAEGRLACLRRNLNKNAELYLIFEGCESVLAISGKLFDAVYVIREGSSIVDGQFVHRDDFQNTYSSYSVFPKTENTLKFAADYMSFTKAPKPGSKTVTEKSKELDFFSSFGRVVFKFDRQLRDGLIIREYSLRNPEKLLDTILDESLFAKMARKDWNFVVAQSTSYRKRRLAEFHIYIYNNGRGKYVVL